MPLTICEWDPTTGQMAVCAVFFVIVYALAFLRGLKTGYEMTKTDEHGDKK